MSNDVVIEELSVAYEGGREVLSKLTALFESGKATLITGPSGSGKTTLLRVISTVIPYVIKAKVSGTLKPDPTYLRKYIYYVPQEPWYSIVTPYVWSEVMSFSKLKLSMSDIKELLRKYGLHDLLSRPTYTLSSGELQRLSIASAEVSGRSIFLLDEPTSHLDKINALKVVNVVKGILKEIKATVIIIDHDVSKWESVVDKVYFLSNGRLEPLRLNSDPYKVWRRKIKELGRGSPGSDVVCRVNVRRFKYPGMSKYVLSNVSFSVRRGEVLLIRGPSGSGKTTLLKLIASRRSGSSYEVSVNGKVLYIPDNPLLYFSEPTPIEEVRGRYEVLKLFGVDCVAKSPIMRLSTGERRRVAIASALVRGADLILLDEPTVGLDPRSKYFVLESIVKARSRGTSFVIASHDDDILSICDEVITLE